MPGCLRKNPGHDFDGDGNSRQATLGGDGKRELMLSFAICMVEYIVYLLFTGRERNLEH
jgi:hypothetical protein